MKNCPSVYVGWLPRIAFGLVLAGYGVNHYRGLDGFVDMAKGAYPTVPILASIAGLLAYIVPLLMIVGGVLFAVRKLGCIGKTCIVASLSGILGWAGLAVMVGDGDIAGRMGLAIQNAAMLFILYYIIKKTTCCAGSCAAPTSQTPTMS